MTAVRDETHWPTYNEAQATRRPRPLCTELVRRAGPGNGRLALDLGCGAGVETGALLGAGWRVVAVDSDPGTPHRVRRLVGDSGDVEVVVADLAEFEPPPADLVHASYSLPFVPPAHFDPLWQCLRRSLRPGGWLAADLFGDRDEWAGEPGMSFVEAARLDSMLNGLDVVSLEEEDAIGSSFSGPKHWHVFHVVARRPVG